MCVAAPELRRFGVPAGKTEGADGGAGEVGCPGPGAVSELRAAGGRPPAIGPGGGCRAPEAPAQQKEPGGETHRRRGREGYDDADDILHGSCKTPTCFKGGSLYGIVNIANC